jgi:hypothetical protein
MIGDIQRYKRTKFVPILPPYIRGTSGIRLRAIQKMINMNNPSFGKITVNQTTTYKDKVGRTDFSVRTQAGQEVYFDSKGRRLGCIDSQGRTLSADNRLLNSQTRPDLLLNSRNRS